jgi:hypothetical protein
MISPKERILISFALNFVKISTLRKLLAVKWDLGDGCEPENPKF